MGNVNVLGHVNASGSVMDSGGNPTTTLLTWQILLDGGFALSSLQKVITPAR